MRATADGHKHQRNVRRRCHKPGAPAPNWVHFRLMAEEIEETHQVRWVVPGPISPTPSGERFSLHRGNFNEWLEERKLTISASIPDELGSAESLEFEIVIEKLRALTLKGITTSVPKLSKLLSLAGDVRDLDGAIEAVREICGDGALVEKLAAIEGKKPEAKKDGDAPTPGSDVFESAGMPTQKPVATAAVDAFLRAAQPAGKKVRRSKSARKIRDMLEEAVYATGRAMLASPEVAAVEGALRGLQLLLKQCPEKSGFTVDVFDVPADEATDILRNWKKGDLVDEPDGVFIPFPVTDIKTLLELAELGEELLCPVIVDVPPTLLGFEDIDSMVDKLMDLEPKDADIEWLALRQEECTRWLCAISNGVIVLAEGVGVAQRMAQASGVWAFGAILSKSYSEVGNFARITGRPGALSAPGVHTIKGGHNDGMAAPTEAFIPIRGQGALAKHGLLALGSARNSDNVILATAPMVRGSADAVPLPAQLLTGRIVRFSQWVRDQLPVGADAKTVHSVFEAAAKVFLFPGMQDVGEVSARLDEEDGERSIFIQAKVHPAHAGVPFEIGFPLPLD